MLGSIAGAMISHREPSTCCFTEGLTCPYAGAHRRSQVLYQVQGQRTGIPMKGALTGPGALNPLTCSLSLPFLSPILPLTCPTFLPNHAFHWLLGEASLQAPHQGSCPPIGRTSLL